MVLAGDESGDFQLDFN